ncbi:hypothetical protein [Paeniglutamicibacter terrestris]|uniref:DUF2255 family protein n=1 Tax=Paeniglutamicibacter terrestris TaxID=2723403 RepID=A0ABX1G7I5_9MICC|nr:hypothetical protein [Paeniglutamicibacter terrestris]NKG22221.1 hypothetical protein [Paeniglutamicibacter terrestris]
MSLNMWHPDSPKIIVASSNWITKRFPWQEGYKTARSKVPWFVMIAKTSETLEDAISAHVTDETQGMVTEWVVYATAIAPDCHDGERWYSKEVPPNQPMHTTLGLLHKATIETEETVRDRYRDS